MYNKLYIMLFNLPLEIRDEIYNYLPVKDLLTLVMTNKLFKNDMDVYYVNEILEQLYSSWYVCRNTFYNHRCVKLCATSSTQYSFSNEEDLYLFFRATITDTWLNYGVRFIDSDLITIIQPIDFIPLTKRITLNDDFKNFCKLYNIVNGGIDDNDKFIMQSKKFICNGVEKSYDYIYCEVCDKHYTNYKTEKKYLKHLISHKHIKNKKINIEDIRNYKIKHYINFLLKYY